METTQFTIGAEASCTDGACGAVSRVVVDPVARAVTHLVVEPAHRQGLGRLVVSGSGSPGRKCRTCRPSMSITRTGDLRRAARRRVGGDSGPCIGACPRKPVRRG